MFTVEIGREVQKDIKKLGLSKQQILKLQMRINEIAENPLSKQEGGYGELLSGNLKGLLKFRFDNDYRVVYQVVRTETLMKVIIIGLRSDQEVYRTAALRK